MPVETAMMKLIKSAEVHAPEPMGRKDVLIAGGTIAAVRDSINPGKQLAVETVDAKGKLMVPGFIDAHVHIVGGGGEGGYRTRTPEIMLSDIIEGGVTTVVGCLGTDGTSRTMSNLIAKAKGLKEEGISCFAYTGSYAVPVRTLTGSIQDDIILIEEIIGVGEIAVSDHRSSQPTAQEIARIAGAARVGGMLSGKAGIVNIHMGDGDRRLDFLEEIVGSTEIPITQFLPTHVGRNSALFQASVEYAKRGGFIDFTTSTLGSFSGNQEMPCSRLLRAALEAGAPADNITLTSDGQGSLPEFDKKGRFIGLGVGKVTSLYREVRDAIVKENVSIESALKSITLNPARILKLAGKGRIQAGNDADLVLLDEALRIDAVLARGRFMVRDKEILVKGTFER